MKKALLLCAVMVVLLYKPQAQTVTDYDGNVYDTISIGAQVWMKQNLKVTHFSNGTPIPNVSDSATWAGLTSAARCYYNNDSAAYDSVYGVLYNGYVVLAINICPDGWHVSSNAEWQTAETYLGGTSVAGGKMKEAGTTHWLSPNTGATNSSGFTGLPGGIRTQSSEYSFIGENGIWWTRTSSGSSLWSTYLWNQFAGVDHNPVPKKYGMSIRCIKDNNTGTGETGPADRINIYPNPAQGTLHIDCSYDKTVLSIYNATGTLVLQKELAAALNQTDISQLAPGLYLVRVTGAQASTQIKIIKE